MRVQKTLKCAYVICEWSQRQPKQFGGQTFNGAVGQVNGRPGPGFEGQTFNGPVGNQRRPSTGQQLTGTRYVYRVQDFHKKFF